MSNIQTQLNLSSSPVAHYSVKDVSVEHDQQIHTWNDVSGNNNHLSATAINSRAVSSITTDGPTLKNPQDTSVGAIDRVVYFDNDKMYCSLTNPLTTDNVDVFIICRAPDRWTTGHIMGLESSSGGKGFSFGTTNNTSNYLSVCDSNVTLPINHPSAPFSIYRMSINSTELITENVMTNSRDTLARTTILDIQSTPLDILTLGSGLSKAGVQQLIRGVEIVEVVIFNSVLSVSDRDKVVNYMIDKHDLTNKYLTPTSGSCIHLDGDPATFVRLTENTEVGPSVSGQQSLPVYNDGVQLLTSSMYEVWFYPEWVDRDDHPRYELVFSFDSSDSQYVYLDRSRRYSSTSELQVRNRWFWWYAGYNTTSSRVYNQWNRLCMVEDGKSKNCKVFLNGQLLFTGDSGYVRRSNLDNRHESVQIGSSSAFSSEYGCFTGKLLGVRKIRGEYQDLIDHASEKIRFDQLDTNTSTHVTPAEDIGLAPLYRNLQNITKKPGLINNTYQPKVEHSTGVMRADTGFNALNPDFTGAEKSLNCYNRIQQSYGRFKNMRAFRDLLNDNPVFAHVNVCNLLHGRLETLSDLRGSLFNERSNWYRFDVTNNRLTSLDGIQDMRHARYMYFNDNNITDISALSELEPGSLENTNYINLSNNKITQLPGGVFSKLPNLHELNVGGNPLTSISGVSSASNLTSFTISNLTNINIQPISDLPKLRTFHMEKCNPTALPPLSNTQTQWVTLKNNPNLVDVSSLANVVKTEPVSYSKVVSTTDSLYSFLQISDCPVSDTFLSAAASTGKRITCIGRMYLYNLPELNDLSVFQNSYQDDTFLYKTNHDHARLMLTNTAVTDTANSLGIMKRFKYCARIYLNKCPMTSLHRHAMPANPTLSRDEAYSVYFGRYFHLDSTTINDMTFLLNPQAAGIQYLYMAYSAVTYEAFAAIKTSLINLKKTNKMRLVYISLIGSDWDNKQRNGQYGPLCVNGAMSPQLRLKKELWDVGIKLHFNSGTTGLGTSSQLPTC